jgi:hypothetical protein
VAVAYLRHYHRIFPGGTEEDHKNAFRDSNCLDPDYEAGVTTHSDVHKSNKHTNTHIRGCIQKFPEWLPGARTANGTALCAAMCSCIVIL